MKRATVLFLAAVCCAFNPIAAANDQGTAPFELPPLPYETDALEPAIDATTMTIHHDKHHQGYVDNLNKALADNAELAGQTLEQLVAKAGSLPTVVRNNAGGHWNHTFFWTSMAPPARRGSPSAALTAAITKDFGSMEKLRAAFKEAGTSRFGSGWVWLIVNDQGRLAITSTPNQDNPLMDVADVKGNPILGNDVWEHAYYLKYQNRRADYLTSWWQVVDWQEVSQRYAAARARNPK